MKLFMCEICGNVAAVVKDSGVTLECCGQEMTELVPGTTDGAVEKHIPEVKVEGNKVTVTVGSVEHPMTDMHYIEWIEIETVDGSQKKVLHPGERPCVEFLLTEGDSVLTVYAYCNLHGLWRK